MTAINMFATANDIVGCRLNFNRRSLTVFMIICILFANCYDSAKTVETTSALILNTEAHRNSTASQISSNISQPPRQQQQQQQQHHQPKPSSVIYIPSLDGIK